RQSTDEFRNQPVFDEIFRLDLLERRSDLALGDRLDIGLEAERLLADAPFDDLVEADERAAANEENVRRVYLKEFLVRMFAPALRRDVGDGAFENLQQCLLNTLPRHVAGDGRVLVLPADLIAL